MAPSQLQARTKRRNKRAFWTSPFGTIWQSFFLYTRLPEGRKNRKTQKVIAFSYGRTIQWAFRSDRPDPMLGSFWQGRTHAVMQNRDHLGDLHHKEQKSITNKHERKQYLQNVHMQRSNGDSILDSISEFLKTVFKTVIENLDMFRKVIKQYSNSIQTVLKTVFGILQNFETATKQYLNSIQAIFLLF